MIMWITLDPLSAAYFKVQHKTAIHYLQIQINPNYGVSVLLCWKTNKAVMTTREQIEDTKDSDDDVVILGSHQQKFGSKRDINESKEVNKKYSSLLSVVSTMSKQELMSGLLQYIQQMNCAEAMEKYKYKVQGRTLLA